MRRWWEKLVEDVFDRMDGFVAAAHRGRLDDEEHEQAVQLSMIRFSHNLMHTFEGTSMGQLVNASRTLAHGICMDVQRKSMRDRKDTRSLDDGWDTAPEDAPAPRWEAEEAVRRAEQEGWDAEKREFREWAIPHIPNDNQRRAVEMTFEGLPLEEIVEALGVTRANAYQLRSRGLKALRRLKEQFDA